MAEDRLNLTTSLPEPASGHNGLPRWRDVSAPPAERVADLLARMTLAEKIAQLGSVWLESEAPGGEVAPHQDDLGGASTGDGPAWSELIQAGMGHLTRPFGTRPVTAQQGAVKLRLAGPKVLCAPMGAA